MNGAPDLNSDGRTRRRLFWIAGLTAAVALALAPLSFHVENKLDTAVRLKGSESDYVAQQLAMRFRSPFGLSFALPNLAGAGANTVFIFVIHSLPSDTALNTACP